MASVLAYLVIPIISGSEGNQAEAIPLVDDDFQRQTYSGNDHLADHFTAACPGYQLDQISYQTLPQELGIEVHEDSAPMWRSVSDGEEYRLLVDGVDHG